MANILMSSGAFLKSTLHQFNAKSLLKLGQLFRYADNVFNGIAPL